MPPGLRRLGLRTPDPRQRVVTLWTPIFLLPQESSGQTARSHWGFTSAPNPTVLSRTGHHVPAPSRAVRHSGRKLPSRLAASGCFTDSAARRAHATQAARNDRFAPQSARRHAPCSHCQGSRRHAGCFSLRWCFGFQARSITGPATCVAGRDAASSRAGSGAHPPHRRRRGRRRRHPPSTRLRAGWDHVGARAVFPPSGRSGGE